ncbi:retrovirus-related pol polyprotein from transposon TNT 1-94 [Tanacetum coccineum]
MFITSQHPMVRQWYSSVVRQSAPALKDDLRKLKGKALVDNDVTKHPSDPKMLKIDVEPITQKLLNNRTAHSAYIKHTQEEVVVLRDLIEHVKANYPLDQPLESACRSSKLFFGAMGKSKKKPHKRKSEDTNQEKLYLLHVDLCGPMRVASVNGKKYILVIVDDYSRFTWVKCLRSKDEAPDFKIKFLKMIQVGISHETSVARSPQQNGVVEIMQFATDVLTKIFPSYVSSRKNPYGSYML